ncbi:MAG: hypothetical protein ACREQ7_21215 [Candidatus Binatia bacterium]
MKSIIGHMDAVRIETTVDEHGEVHLTKLPFPAGEPVEVIVVPKPFRQQRNGFPLRGVPIEYDRPTDPVAEEDWNALR